MSTDRPQYREVLATLAEKTKTKLPTLNGRVEKATRLALMGDIELHPDGHATVYSSSDPTRRYEIIDGMCPCRDWEQAPEHLCQHRLAAGFVRKAATLLPPAPAAAPAAASVAPEPLYEAPSSVNVRLTIGGREVQLTLRDTSEARLLVRPEEVLQRYPLPQAAAPSTGQSQEPLSPQQHNAAAMHRPVTEFCPVHHVQMTLNDKNGQQWWSHRTADGWCKGR